MELIVYLTLALVAFSSFLLFVIGLVSAPTPILITILVFGLVLTERSINKLDESNTDLFTNKDKNKIEKVELTSKDAKTETDIKAEKVELLKSMTYRGYSYDKKPQNKSVSRKPKNDIKYRGANLSDKNKINEA